MYFLTKASMEDPASIPLLVKLGAVLVLVTANAFFVAAEFSLVAARRTRIESMAKAGDRKARAAHHAIGSLDRYISGTQLGITVASLGLGWIGEPAVASVLEGMFVMLPDPFSLIATHTVAVTVAFMFITFLHIVLGELAPKAVALMHPEATSRWLAGPLIGFTHITNPFIWLLNGSANAVVKLLGVGASSESDRVHQPDEIVMLVKQSQRSGQLASQDVEMIEGVFEFTEKQARDVMTPRTDVIALKTETTLEEAIDVVTETGVSRYPIYEESLDEIVGVVHAKEILANLKSRRFQPVSSIMREAAFIPGTREIEDVLTDMKRSKNHLAVVLDEYGGTAGIVTMEDLLEEIVGEIYDESDRSVRQDASESSAMLLAGDTPISDANKTHGFEIDEEDYQTLGGFVFGTLGRLPNVGDSVETAAGLLKVREMYGRRVRTLQLIPAPAKTTSEDSE